MSPEPSLSPASGSAAPAPSSRRTSRPACPSARARSWEQGAIVASSSTVRHELSELEGLGHAQSSPHLGRTRAHDRGVPLLHGGCSSGAGWSRGRSRSTSAVRAASSIPHSDSRPRRSPRPLISWRPSRPRRSTPPWSATSSWCRSSRSFVMAVVITASGGVAKRLFVFEQAVDAGLLEWARDYINEAIVGLRLGARTLRQRLSDPSLAPAERGILERLEPVFTQLVRRGLPLPGRRCRPARRSARRRARVTAGGRQRARGAPPVAGGPA